MNLSEFKLNVSKEHQKTSEDFCITNERAEELMTLAREELQSMTCSNDFHQSLNDVIAPACNNVNELVYTALFMQNIITKYMAS